MYQIKVVENSKNNSLKFRTNNLVRVPHVTSKQIQKTWNVDIKEVKRIRKNQQSSGILNFKKSILPKASILFLTLTCILIGYFIFIDAIQNEMQENAVIEETVNAQALIPHEIYFQSPRVPLAQIHYIETDEEEIEEIIEYEAEYIYEEIYEYEEEKYETVIIRYGRMDFTQEEVYLLARMIHSEAHWEPWIGKIAVGQTALDRWDGNPNRTLTQILRHPGAFVIANNRHGCDECLRAARAVLEYGELALPDYYLFHFRSQTFHTRDWYQPYITHIYNHAFYGQPRSATSVQEIQVPIITIEMPEIEMEILSETYEPAIVNLERNVPVLETVIHEPIRYDEERELEKTFLGYFQLTFYCLCIRCCGVWSWEHPNNINNPNFVQRTASGTIPAVGRTVAVDNSRIRFGTELYISGFGWRVAEDTGSAVTGNIIDVFVETHNEALQLGRMRNIRVYTMR